MMKKVIAVYDSKAEFFRSPMIFDSRGQAIRGFQDLANDDKTEIGKYGGDFTLFELGEWDQITGQYLIHEAKISLGTALEFKRPSA